MKTLTLYQTLELQSADRPCHVIVNMWETHQQPRTMCPTGIEQQNTVHGVVGFGKVCHTQTPYGPPIPYPSTILNSC